MVDTLPVSPPGFPQSPPQVAPPSAPAAFDAVTPEQPQTTPPSAPAPVSTPQTVPGIVSEGSDLAERPDLLSVEYAGFGARFLALAVDGMIVGAIYLILMIPVLIMGVMTAAGGRQNPAAVAPLISVLGLLFQLIGWAATVGYYIYFTAKGQTLGKKALKIKVVGVENAQAPGYTKAFLREVVGKMVSAMIFGLGYLWMLWDGKKQTWHDKIAGTVVVKL